jgi:hypothetical protein
MLSSNVLCTFLTNTQLLLTLWTWRHFLWIRNQLLNLLANFHQKLTGFWTPTKMFKNYLQRPFQIISFSKAAIDLLIPNFAVLILDTRYTYFFVKIFQFDGFKVPWTYSKKLFHTSKHNNSHLTLHQWLRFFDNFNSRHSRIFFEARRHAIQGIFHDIKVACPKNSPGLQLLAGQHIYLPQLQDIRRRNVQGPSDTTGIIRSNGWQEIDLTACNHGKDKIQKLSPPHVTYVITFEYSSVHMIWINNLHDSAQLHRTYMAQINDFFSSPRPPDHGVECEKSLDFFANYASSRAAYRTPRQLPGPGDITGMYGPVRAGAGSDEDLRVLHKGQHDYATPSTLHLITDFRAWSRAVMASQWSHANSLNIAAYGNLLRGLWLAEDSLKTTWETADCTLQADTLTMIVVSTVTALHGVQAEFLHSLIDTLYSTTAVSFETFLGVSVKTLPTLALTADEGCWQDNSGQIQLDEYVWIKRTAGADTIPFIYDE